MEKKQINVSVPNRLDWEDTNIVKIRKDLDALEALGITDISIEVNDYFDSYSLNYYTSYNREETDEETTERINKELNKETQIKAQELKMLQQLKAKYE